MSLSFPCPGCHAQITVADEHAGRHGQCPRCRQVFEIPLSTEPPPEPSHPETPTVSVPPADPWAPREEPEPEPELKPETEAAPPKPATKPARAPHKPAAPLRIWAWAIGVFLAAIMLALLVASVAVLAFWRRAERAPNIDHFADMPLRDVLNKPTVGRLEGNRVFPDQGIFQIRTALTDDDPPDPEDMNCRCKRYEIELRNDRVYVFEQESNQFDCYLRVEDQRRLPLMREGGDRAMRRASFDIQPAWNGVYIVYASSRNPDRGDFVLTIRERNAPKPFGP